MNVTGTSLVVGDPAAAVAYGLSHDLRARLRATSGFLELARADLDDDSETAYLLQRAAAAAGLADLMTERLVRYLRIPPVADVTITASAELIEDAIDRCPERPGSTIESLPDVLADGALLTDAIVEILDNAVRFRAVDRPPTVQVTGSTHGPWAVLRFVDNGTGIHADRGERAFELFRQVHRVGDSPGSGMGLPIARRIIELHGGAITLEPDPGGGSVVEIRLQARPGQ